MANKSNISPNSARLPRRKRIRGSAALMILAILVITGFQFYWLKNNYDRERQALEIKTNAAFRQTILRLQASKLKLEDLTFTFDSTHTTTIKPPRQTKKHISLKRAGVPQEPDITLLNLFQERMRDSLILDTSRKNNFIISVGNDSMRRVILDSIRKTGKVNIMITHSRDSQVSVPRVIKEMDLNKGEPKNSKIVAVDYSTRPRFKDTLAMESETGIIMESDYPVPISRDVLRASPPMAGPSSVVRFLYDVDSLSIKDSVTVKEISLAFGKRLDDENINIDFNVSRLDSNAVPPPDAVTIGFTKPTRFDLTLESTLGYMFDKLKLPILFSILLVGLTIASFVLLYRNMLKQQRLAELKNEFISNITHELKTPIATVGVAIEALKNFNAIEDPQRTREYLDISQLELQRLNLLVDKVLKLSMFEKKEIELKYETLNLKEIVDEVISSLRLQIEKYNARVIVRNEGVTHLQGDRLHLLSVVFNLVDNALKYSKENPELTIDLKEEGDNVLMIVTDNGIGIPQEYQEKVFEKFFRIPHGDTHNAKGYGLGLSYAAHVVRKHNGMINVTNAPAQGAIFTITLPKNRQK